MKKAHVKGKRVARKAKKSAAKRVGPVTERGGHLVPKPPTKKPPRRRLRL